MTDHTPAAPLPRETRLHIGEYTLGTLSGSEESQLRDLINSNDEAVHLALHWETVLLAMADRLPPVSPEPLILSRIQRTLGLPRLDPEVQPLWRPESPTSQPPAAPVSSQTPGPARANPHANATHGLSSAPTPGASTRAEPVMANAGLRPDTPSAQDSNRPESRTAIPADEPLSPAVAADEAHHQTREVHHAWYARPLGMIALVVLAGLGVLAYTALRPNAGSQTQGASTDRQAAPTPPDTLSIAILQPPNSTSSPGWIITQVGSGQLRAEPRLQSDKAPDQGLALWARGINSPETRFLGWLDDTTVSTLALPDGVVLDENALFEITLEKTGTDTTRTPEGVVLFIGQAIKTVIPDPKTLSLPPVPTATPAARPR
ncbi:MAG: anti-sigma factor [Pusillimonas sp.]